MASAQTIRIILPDSRSFKKFFDSNGPFKFALTSREYPPVLLEEEEWIFSNDLKALFKDLMQFEADKMKFVRTPFDPGSRTVLRPGDMSEWKILNFPEDWNHVQSDFFIPEGHLTVNVLDRLENKTGDTGPGEIEDAFFRCLEMEIEQFGYHLFKPKGKGKRAAIQEYLKEWMEDDAEAGI